MLSADIEEAVNRLSDKKNKLEARVADRHNEVECFQREMKLMRQSKREQAPLCSASMNSWRS